MKSHPTSHPDSARSAEQNRDHSKASRARFILFFLLSSACAFEPVASVQQAADLPADVGSSAVGSIPYTTHVDDFGRLHVDVPLVLPPGRHGIEPSLSLHYDSGAGDSLVGTGWSLQGLSRLHRCFHRAGMADEPLRASIDGYCLDGVPLVSGGDGYWRTFPDTHVRIEQLVAADEWVVHELSGRKMVLGGTSDSVQRDAFGKSVAWHMSSVRDEWGNSYHVSYGVEELEVSKVVEPGVFLRPLAISYTHHPSRAATRKIDFIYGTPLSAPRSHWERASHQLRTDVLSAIRVSAVRESVAAGDPVPAMQPVTEYRLQHHELAVSAPRVIAVEHCAYSSGGAALTCLPPLRFFYDAVRGNVQGGWDDSPTNRPRAVDISTFEDIPEFTARNIWPFGVGEFDGEPGEELLLLRNPEGESLIDSEDDWQDEGGGHFWVAKPELVDGEEQIVRTNVRYIDGWYALGKFLHPLIADVNDDGLDDILQWSQDDVGFRVHLNQGGVFELAGVHHSEFTEAPRVAFVTDAMGDARQELVYCRPDPTRPNLGPLLKAHTWSIASLSLDDPQVMHTDIACFPPPDREVCPIGIFGWSTMPGNTQVRCTYDETRIHPTIADFDGDGLSDWLVWSGDDRSAPGLYTWDDETRLVRRGPIVQGDDLASMTELRVSDLLLDDGTDRANDNGTFKIADLNGDGSVDLISFVPDFVTRFPSDPPGGFVSFDEVVRGHLEVRWGHGSVSSSAEAGVWFSGPRELPTAFEITSREFAQRAFFDDVDGNGAVDLIGPFVAGDEFEPPGHEHDALGLRWLVESGSTAGLSYHTVALDPFFMLAPTSGWNPPRSVGQRPTLMGWVPFDGDGDGSRRHAVWQKLGEIDAWQISRFPRPITWVLSGVTQSRVDSGIAHSRRYRWGHLEDPDLHTPSTDSRCIDGDPEGGHAAGRTDCLRRGGPVVRESWIEYGPGFQKAPWTQERFRYEGALFDRFERRSLGFERRIVENLEAGTRTAFNYDPWTTLPSHGRPRLRAGVPLKTHTEVFQRTTDTGLAEESSVFTRVVERQTETVTSGNTYFVYPRVEITHEKTDGEETFTSSRDARRDARGLVRESKVTVGDEQVDSTTFEYDFFDVAYRATPNEVNRTRCRVMRCSSTSEELKWSSLTGAAEGPIVLLHRRVIGANSGESYDYFAYNEGWDELGHATRLRETVEGVADASRFTERTTYFDFGDHDAFAPTAVKNALGHKSQVTHHPVWGRPSQSIDPNGFRVDWRYDGFGRLREVSAPTIGMRRTIVESELPDGTFEQRIVREGYTLGRSVSDGLGRVRLSAQRVPGGALVDATTEYDPRTGLPVSSGLALPGRVRETVAYAPEVPLGPGERWTAELARPRRLTNVLGGVTRVEYAGRTVRTTDPRGGVTVEVYGLDGLVRSVTDPATTAGTAETTYEYDEHEALRLTTDALGFEYLVERDRFGRVVEAHHPDSGYDEVEYDAWGLPAFVVHRPTGIRYTADIDELGRTTAVVARRGTTEQRNVWEYDTATYGIGLLHRSTSSDGVVEVLGYEAGGLLRERTVEVDGRSYRTRIRQRGRDGRIERLDVPLSGSSSGVRSIGYQYDNPGFLRAVEPYGSATPWWERVDVAADGQTTLERFHATSVATDHDPATGLVQEVAFQAGSTLLGRYGYDYDSEGRLAWREQRNWTGSPESLRREEFTYDARGQLERVRLENAAGSLLQERSYTYDLLGNLQTAVRPAGTRQYVRDPAYPHRTDRTTGHDPRDLTYDERGQVTSSGTATVTYDLFGRPTSITEPVSRGSRQFAYDAAGNLVRTSSSKGIAYRPDAMTEEVVGGSSYVLHRIGGENVSGVLTRQTGWTTDQMLSQVLVEPASAAMTLNGTTVVENYSFDEWGIPRGADWMSTTFSSIGGTAGLVGFAGHLHAGVDALLTRFQHMGARLYDRDLGLMTSPDPITNPRRALDLNPFAYAWNDPLNVLDPTGMNEEPEYGAVAVVDRGGYPYLVGSPGSLASALGWAESLIESACGGAALCQFDGFGVGRQFTPRAFTPLSSGAPTGRSRPPARPQPARSRPDGSGRPRQPSTSLVESNPPARRVQQSAWSDILTFADGVASGLNPFDDHRAGPVENGDPDVWNVGRAFGSGAGLIGDALLIFQGGQMVGGGAALTVAGQIEVGVPAMAVGSAAVGAGTIMAPRHAQQFGASIVQMGSRQPHRADWEHRNARGQIQTRGRERSGSDTPPGRRLSFREQLEVHTETKILARLRGVVQRGDIITIRGTASPCNPGGSGCHRAMSQFASERGVTIRYTYGDGTWVYRPNADAVFVPSAR